GIAEANVGGTVNVEAGTFTENVALDRQVALRGAFAGTPGDDGVRGGAGESVLQQVATGDVPLVISASGATVDGMQIANVTGPRMVRIQSVDQVSFVNNRLLDYVSTASTGTGISSGSTQDL